MFYIDLDVNKDFGFKIMIYYVLGDVLKDTYSLRFNICLVFFLNRLLRDVKTRY